MNIAIKNLTFSYDERLLFDQANINIDENWRLGLIGRNGRGKTTLLNVLRGNLQASAEIKAKKKFIYFPQEINDLGEITIHLLQQIADFEQWQLERELTLLKVDLDVLWRPFSSLSAGEQTKCLLSLLFLADGCFPLIDEPTNHLDSESREIVSAYLKKKSGFIVVSHDAEFLDSLVDHILAIEKSQIQLYQGDLKSYKREKQLRDDFEKSEDEKLRSNIEQLRQAAKEKEKWSYSRESNKMGDPRKKGSGGVFDKGHIGARSARMMKRSKNLEKRMNLEISEKEKLLKNLETAEPLKMNFQVDFHKTLLHFENFSLAYEKPLFESISESLEKGEILSLVGVNGIGKSSIFHFLTHNFHGKTSGKAKLSKQIKISTVRQLHNNTGSLKEFSDSENLNYEMFLSSLRKLGMERETFRQRIETMSEGQKKKVELAKSLSQPAQLYIWDEPLNYLDIFNREQLAEVLKKAKPSMLLIEHDQSFVREVSTRIVELKKIW